MPIDDSLPEPRTSVTGETTEPDVVPTRTPTSPARPVPVTEPEPDDDRYEQL